MVWVRSWSILPKKHSIYEWELSRSYLSSNKYQYYPTKKKYIHQKEDISPNTSQLIPRIKMMIRDY